jgi:enoyl-CoA hydratase
MAVQVTLAEARAALGGGAADAAARLRGVAPALLASADAQEGIASLIERRSPVFTGA